MGLDKEIRIVQPELLDCTCPWGISLWVRVMIMVMVMVMVMIMVRVRARVKITEWDFCSTPKHLYG